MLGITFLYYIRSIIRKKQMKNTNTYEEQIAAEKANTAAFILATTTDKDRYKVVNRIEFGMLFGYKIYDTLESVQVDRDFDEDELYSAANKCHFYNVIN